MALMAFVEKGEDPRRYNPKEEEWDEHQTVKDKTRQIPKRTTHASRNAEPERFGLGEADIVAFCNRLALTSAAPATLPSPFPQETHFMSTRSLTR